MTGTPGAPSAPGSIRAAGVVLQPGLSHPDRSVLIVRTGAMGDVLHALPAVAALRTLEPRAHIGWVVDPRWAPLLVNEAGDGPVVSRVHLAETRLWSQAPVSMRTLRSVGALRRGLRAEQYGFAVDMQGTLRSAVLGRMAGTARLAGYADPREALATLLYGERLGRPGTHVVEQGAALLGEALQVPITPAAVALPHEPAAERWAEGSLARVAGRPVALLAPAAGWGAKQWPAVRFGELARALRAQGVSVLVNAAHPGEPAACAVVEASAGAAEIAVCSVAALIALTRRAAVVVGGDSGPVHLAAALGRPLVALFGLTDPARNGPWGSGSMRVLRDPASATSYKRRAETDPGLAQIGVEQVLRAALQVAAL